ncbi:MULTISPECIES: ureidoglycolate lyase [unclassified Chelatococcus]|uniref:ureidoglycolate lyase n=1 Tax=unclassified Chelatococcus TaxID=2638111 RepID=UPI001BCF08A1|nr:MULTISPECIES: ureidoglycolate lyase [unclassified Chelatococcus]MBS7698702.1 ureidoglycolate lyase [Chelatococcus sp. YT9]MBX3554716.1 ureidoglycolate lyase [Chelatococcus sp.]
MQRFKAVPLTAEAFAPYGEVLAHKGETKQQPVPGAFDRTDDAPVPSLALLRIDAANALPVVIDRLERHPFSAQSFIPTEGGRCLIIVCDTATDGSPDIASTKAFISEKREGITYKRNVWHRSVTALEAPSQFAVVMAQTGDGRDNLFFDLPAPIEVVAD